MDKINNIEKLKSKFVSGTITKSEKKTLYSHYKPLFSDPSGRVSYTALNNFLIVTHSSYKIPVEGIVSLV